jgi:di-heme oxidoreductase (putative peroxidase)
MREAVLAHAGEAENSRERFEGLSASDRDAIVEFLKSLQILPAGTQSLCVDEDGKGTPCSSPEHASQGWR